MLLHEDKTYFLEFIRATASVLGYTEEQIEKDYFVSLFLKNLLQLSDLPIVFKGGTSLSKAYHLINRFSEDLDLAVQYDGKRLGDGKRKKLKSQIIKVSQLLGMKINNIDRIESDKDFNQYEVTYENHFTHSESILPHLLIETILVYQPYPYEEKQITTYIYEYLFKIGEIEIIDKYKLSPFKAIVQTIERTLIDKLFAVCDYHIQGKYFRYSRHLYDIHKIWSSLELNKGCLKDLVQTVIKDRQINGKHNVSCLPGVNPKSILIEITTSDVYKRDYHEVTSEFIIDDLTYEDCIYSVKEIIDSDIIPTNIEIYS